MDAMVHKRDYSLTGPDGRLAVERGLAAAQWYHTDVPRREMKALMQRSDMSAIRDTVIWLGLMAVFALAAAWTYPSLWSVPFFLAFGVLYGSASDSRWHECSHGTAFRTQWMNQWVYQIASFMIMRNPVVWRWSHTRHHTDTYIVGRDPEIAVMRPPVLFKLLLNIFGILDAYDAMGKMLRHALTGQLTVDEKTYVPESEWAKAIRVARIWFVIYAVTIMLAVHLNSLLPVLLVGTPRLYGAWHHIMTGLLQHGGLADNVLDHRMNSRTVRMNPISRFIYWNMNYHIEHHMFPMVPYHALPRLHELIKSDLPEASSSQWVAYKNIFPIWLRQLKGEECFLSRELPATAKPYRPDFHSHS